jgi:uncharacterized protein
MTRTTRLLSEPDRVHVLDVLRGIALFGMFLVHFSMYSSGGHAVDQLYQRIVALIFEERFWAMFGMLFGVGFAIQLRRADARGASFVPNFVRRLAALALFGFVAHAFFGFNVLLGYAFWGLPLLLVRRWSVRSLVIAAVVSAISWGVYRTATAAYGVARRGEQTVRAELDSSDARYRAFRQANEKAQDATSYGAVVVARLQHMRWFYAQPFSFLPVNTFTLFLLGLIGLRLGLFDEPERHRRLIVGVALFGAASWAVTASVFPLLPPITEGSIVRVMILNRLQYGLGLVREMWLAFTYIGVVLLLVAHNRQWLQRLAAFGWTGRMALTNYMIQIAILDVTFAKYGLGLTVRPLVGLTMAIALFVADAMFSRWWLARFRYGPFEWLWRSMTYARWQPWRVEQSSSAAPHGYHTAVT